jgi:hypothetical protein
MAASIEESLIEKLRGLPLEKQQEVLEFVEKLDRQETRDTIQAEPKDRMPILKGLRKLVRKCRRKFGTNCRRTAQSTLTTIYTDHRKESGLPDKNA